MTLQNPIVSILLICFLLLSNQRALAGSDTHIIYNMPSSIQTDYMQGLLKLALSYSGKPYSYSTTSETYSRPRLMESVKNGDVSLMWGGTSNDMESQYIPVRIDAYRGLMSHRIFIIREGDQSRFDQINTFDDLKLIKFGQGKSWQDANILEQAGLTVVKTTKKPSLFYMLDGGRFDAFPRGANEAFTETSTFPNLKLTVERKLVIVYPLPTYFFVHKGFPQIAKDIEAGLESMLKDGKFDEYFYKSKEIRDVLERADLPSRKAFYIKNPYLPATTPLERKELWLTIDDLAKHSARKSE